jgi:hypothetical protein
MWRTFDVVGVEEAQGLQGLLELGLDEISRGCGLLDPPRRLEGAGQAQAVEVLQTAQAVLLRPVRGEEIRVIPEHCSPRACSMRLTERLPSAAHSSWSSASRSCQPAVTAAILRPSGGRP